MDISEEDYQKAVAVVRKCLSGSVSNLQRKLYWGYGRAASAIDRMQDEFIVSPMSASGRRDVYPEETHQLWKELQEAKAQAVPKWINTTEILPTENDANNYGQVYVYTDQIPDIVQLFNWNTLIKDRTWWWSKASDRPRPPKVPCNAMIEAQEQKG